METYTPYMRMIILNMGMRHHDTEDLVQSIILKAWKNLNSFEYKPDKAALRSWLKTITKNTVLKLPQKEVHEGSFSSMNWKRVNT